MRTARAGGKADFGHIYNQPDPRSYYRTLGALGYEIPQRALPVVQALLAAQDDAGRRPPSVLDVCCSYGINAALLRHDVTLDQLHERYASPSVEHLSSDELARADIAHLRARRRADGPRVTGLDVAPEAVAYARRTGLIDDGWVEDLEAADPSTELAAELAGVDLVLVTGGVGYVTERTLTRLVSARADGPPPWVAALVLRIYPYDTIAAALAERGLATERLEGVTFRQRLFATDAEREAALAAVRARGLDPAGLEAEGCFHAELFVSRPHEHAARLPLRDLLADLVPG